MGCTSSSSSQKLTGAQKKKLEGKKAAPKPITFEPEEIDPIKIIGRIDVPILLGSDYRVDNYVASGGGMIFKYFDILKFSLEGKVYAATHLPDGRIVALKFFGYEAKKPELDKILEEIRILRDLSGIDGIVGFHGIFMDTVTGIQPGKKHRKPFPVIVMELLTGGELFDRIQIRGEMTEQSLSNLFRHVVETMQQMHNRCYIHR